MLYSVDLGLTMNPSKVDDLNHIHVLTTVQKELTLHRSVPFAS